MIRLKQVTTIAGESTLIFEADGFPEGIRDVQVPWSEIADRLKTVREILGEPVTVDQAKSVIRNIINQLRQQKQPFPQRFDFSAYMGVDLEI